MKMYQGRKLSDERYYEIMEAEVDNQIRQYEDHIQQLNRTKMRYAKLKEEAKKNEKKD